MIISHVPDGHDIADVALDEHGPDGSLVGLLRHVEATGRPADVRVEGFIVATVTPR